MELKHIFTRCGLTQEQFEAFKGRFSFKQYKPEETVFHQGDPSETFYLIQSGELAVSKTSADNRETVLSVLGPGEFFGEIGLLQGFSRIATIKALTHVQLYELGKADFFDLLKTNAAFAGLLERINIRRLLLGIPLFSGLDKDALSKIWPIMSAREGGAGEVLVEEGDVADKLFLLVQGNARMYRTGANGQEITSSTLHAGGYFGEQGLLQEERHQATVVLEGPAKFLVLEGKEFGRLVRRSPSIAFNLPGRGALNAILPFFFNKSAYFAIPALAMNRPRLMVRAMILTTLLLVLPAVLPSLWPAQFSFLNSLQVDTDPENMLPADEPSRLFHKRKKSEMALYDMLVVGVVNETHPNGVFNVETLGRVFDLTRYAATLQWPDEHDPGERSGVRAVDMMAPSSVDTIEQEGPDSVRFAWLMPEPPRTEEEALEIYRRMERFPMMNGTLISQDGKAISLYLPLTSKDISFRVYQALKEHIADFDGEEQYFITGLPVAEDAFGVEMFIQMAISAPLAMLVIFLLMYYFFRNLILIISPMIVALVTVLCTMALLVVTGNTVHIMSSMIPIFLMPIAVLDSVHILSEFFEFYPRIRDRHLTMKHVMDELFVPMLYTTLTTAVGFASLALVPIPPVQVFGIFVSIGVALAWLLSMSFIPAYVLLIPQQRLDALAASGGGSPAPSDRLLTAVLRRTRRFALKRANTIVVGALLLVVACLYGVQQIVVNDNPVRWFAEDHPIRVADDVLNDHFAGTYMAFLSLEAEEESDTGLLLDRLQRQSGALRSEFPHQEHLAGTLMEQARSLGRKGVNSQALLEDLQGWTEEQLDTAPDAELDFWDEALYLVEEERQDLQYFKKPEMLAYVEALQETLAKTGIVGKSVSLVDFSKTINRELRGGQAEEFRIPGSRQAVAQTFLTYEGSHRPGDLWRFVTPDFRNASLWVLLNSGDNRDMSAVVSALDAFMADHPPPLRLSANWFGLTYINVVWQNKMVSGMLFSIAGSYLTVLLLLTFLLRSARWALLAMVPLTATLLVIFGVLGLVGKPYDMPVAVLSALTIGLAVDFTIHFLVRLRHFRNQTKSWQEALDLVFEEPARAISRNILIVAIGFLPLLAAPLIPYNTVGTLIATILFIAGVATLVILPALLKTGEKGFFPPHASARSTVLGCGDRLFAALVVAALIGVGLQPFLPWTRENLPLLLIAVAVPVVLAINMCRQQRTEES